MKYIGIIAEYNPFHEGHRYLIDNAMQAAGADACVSVMSGDFTQRGLPAMTDKWERASQAVKNGVNLVLELPTVCVLSSAEYFASGGIDVLEGLGVVGQLAFGSESGDIEALTGCADLLKSCESAINGETSRLCRAGVPYPKARQQAVSALCPGLDVSLVSEPNNILAIEYLKRLKTMEAITVKRSGEGHFQTATALRQEFAAREPERAMALEKRYFDLLRARFATAEAAELEECFSSGEGLGTKLKNEFRYAKSLNELIDMVKSKAYTRTRITRLLAQTILGITGETVKSSEVYARVLAFDKAGAGILRASADSDLRTVKLITNINKTSELSSGERNALDKDIEASDIYNIITGQDLYERSDYVMMPYRI